MRRPTDRQATRRTVSGDPREICNYQDGPGNAGASAIHGALAISALAGVAALRDALTHVQVRSGNCSRGAFAKAVSRARPALGVVS